MALNFEMSEFSIQSVTGGSLDIGLNIPAILLPKKGTDMAKWAVVACDQYTSQPDYWAKVKEFIGKEPSTLNIIFPEAYLEDEGKEDRIKSINEHMKKYLKDVLVAQKPGFVLVDRKTKHAESRKGLIAALDLEKYDYSRGSQTLIRATEGTIVERLPPRISIRKNAVLELPHIMVLIDDPEKKVIEPLFRKNPEKIYDFSLMMGSGHIKGYKIDDENTLNEIAENLSKLADKELFNKKYKTKGKEVLLFAVGDGNHSLATAKAIWEDLKKTAINKKEIMSHPARHALVELVNVHDDGLEFEPIHRVIFNIDIDNFLAEMKQFVSLQGADFSVKTAKSIEQAKKEAETHREKNKHVIVFTSEKSSGIIIVTNPKLNLEVGTLQSFIDEYLKKNAAAKIDYIHGDDVVAGLGSKKGNAGFLLPVMPKNEFFRTVIIDGVLPRKTFSMGSADEKRFYLECRKIV